jgi:hypothetical protein
MATRNSSLGRSGMRSSRATPPIGSRITSGVCTPKARAVKMWPNSLQQHAQEQQHHEQEPVPGRLRPAGNVAHAENPGQEQDERDMDAHRRAGDRSDVQRPGHGRRGK